MARKHLTYLMCLVVLVFGIEGCATIASDVAHIKADLQANKAKIAAQIPPAIAFAQSKGDMAYAQCLTGILALAQAPESATVDITNPFINLELAHMGVMAGLSGISTLENDPFFQTLNNACAAYYVRTKAEVLDVAAKIGILVRP